MNADRLNQPTSEDVVETTPGGETGVADLRNSLASAPPIPEREDRGRESRDMEPAPVDRMGDASDSPSAEDPYGSQGTGSAAVSGPDPSYEAHGDDLHGGSTDPSNSLSHADSGDETQGGLMNEHNKDQQQKTGHAVDGFSDTEGQTDIASPDPGAKKSKAMSPDEYAKAQREARTEKPKKR